MSKSSTNVNDAPELKTPTDLERGGVEEISEELRKLLADVFTLYLKTKNFHWHMTGPHFRDYHTLLDDQSDQILAATDLIAERVRKVGGNTLRSIGHIVRLQRVIDNDSGYTSSQDVLLSLRGPAGTSEMKIANTSDLAGADWEPYAANRAWRLADAGGGIAK